MGVFFAKQVPWFDYEYKFSYLLQGQTHARLRRMTRIKATTMSAETKALLEAFVNARIN